MPGRSPEGTSVDDLVDSVVATCDLGPSFIDIRWLLTDVFHMTDAEIVAVERGVRRASLTPLQRFTEDVWAD